MQKNIYQKIIFKIILIIKFSGLAYGQEANTGPLVLSNVLSVENYLPLEEGQLPYPSEITGIHQLDKNTVVWVNFFGMACFYDLEKGEVISSTRLTENIITESIFHAESNQLFICEKGKTISIYEINNQAFSLKKMISNHKNNDSITFNDLVLNPKGDQIASFVEDSILVFWQFEEDAWIRDQMSLDKRPFTILYLNDSTLLSGSHDGFIQVINLKEKKITKSKKVFDSAIYQVMLSPDRKTLSITDQESIKLFPVDLRSFTRIKSKIELIGNMIWVGDKKLLVTGYDNGFEFWDLSKKYKKERIQSENVNLNSKKKELKNPHQPTGEAYLILSDGNNDKELKKLYAKVTAIDIDSYKSIAIAQENLDIQMLQIRKEKIYFKEKMNCFDEIAKGEDQVIQDIRIVDDHKVYIGSMLSAGGFDFRNKAAFNFVVIDFWMSYSQIDFTSFKDVKLYKSDSGFEKRKSAKVKLNPYLDVDKKRTKLNKAIRAKSPELRSLLNPSGFEVSSDKNYLMTYDATGHIEIMAFKNLAIVFSQPVTSHPIVKCFFTKKNDFVLVDRSGKLMHYAICNNKVKLIEDFNIASSIEIIEHVAYNEDGLLAIYNKEKIEIFDFIKKEYLSTTKNSYLNYQIDLVEFIPNTAEYVYALNEIGNEKTIPKLKDVTEYKPSRFLDQGLFCNNNLFIMGNSNGEILFYESSIGN